MKLKNPFSIETRWLFFDTRHDCFFCGRNDTELHHIAGRISSSALNASVLCKRCHGSINHCEEEEIKLFKKTFMWLIRIGYNFSDEDLSFAKNYERCERAIRECDTESNL